MTRETTPRSEESLLTTLQVLLNNLPTFSYLRDLNRRRLVLVNHAVEKFTGRSQSELVKLGSAAFDEIVHPTDQSIVDRSSVVTSKELGRDQLDVRLRSARGEYRVISIRELELDESLFGRTGLVLGIATDVTEQRDAEDRLRRNQAFVRRIADVGPTLVSVFDLKKQKTTFANARWQDLHGLDETEMADRGVSLLLERIHPDDIGLFQEVTAWLEQNPEGSVLENEYRIRDHSGDWRRIHTWDSVFGTDPDGEIRSVLSTALDVTDARERDRELRENEVRLQQIQKLESLGVIAGGIAHDFNNLLTGILGYASLLSSEAQVLGEENASYAHEIERAALRAADLCSRLLTYSGRQPLDKKRVDLSQIVEEAEVLLRASLPKTTSVRFEGNANDLPVFADAVEIQQIAINLILNASESLEGIPGDIEISCGAQRLDASDLRPGFGSEEALPGDYVYLEVCDSGSGMDAATKARIFEPFFTTKLSGRGLGLSVVLGIVRHHGGVLFLGSDPGQGTRLRVCLPLHRGEAATEKVAASERESEGCLDASILVIDDEASIREVAREILELAGARVTTMEDGESGLALYRSDPSAFNGALIDITLPGIRGTQVAEEIEKIGGGTRIVLMSGFTQGAALPYHVPFLRKPFDADALVRAFSTPQQVESTEPAHRSTNARDPLHSARILGNS